MGNLAQIISDIATANWVIAIAIILVGGLLARILNRIEKKLEEHGFRITEAERDLAVLSHKNKNKP